MSDFFEQDDIRQSRPLFALLGQLIEAQSTNPGSGEALVAAVAESYIGRCGAEIVRQTVIPQTGDCAARCNLIISLPADEETGEPPLALSAHMDTVVAGDGWSRAPFTAHFDAQTGRIYGRGACDMKAGLACALETFREAAQRKQRGEKTHRELRLVLSVDEEGDMRGAEALVRGGHIGRDALVLDLEPTDGALQIAHKGRLWLEITVHGVTAHASRPELGADAVLAAADCISEMRRQVDEMPVHEVLGPTTITFGKIEGGYQPYVVPDMCRFWVDLRLAPPITERDILGDFEQIRAGIESRMPGIHMAVRVTGSRPYIEEDRTSLLRKALLDAAEAVTGQRPAVEPFPGYTDTAVFAGLTGNRNCMSYGPGSLAQAHKPDEFVPAEDVLRCRRVLGALIDKLIF